MPYGLNQVRFLRNTWRRLSGLISRRRKFLVCAGILCFLIILLNRFGRANKRLTEDINTSDIEALQQLKILYQSCKDTNLVMNQVDKGIVADLLDRLFLPGNSIGKTLSTINRELGVSLMFQVNVDLKKDNNSVGEIFVDQPKLEQARASSMTNIFKKYDVQIEELTKKLGIVRDASTIEQILELDKRLAVILGSPSSDRAKPGNDKRLTLKELNGLFCRELKDLLPGEECRSTLARMRKIDWIEYMDTLFEGFTNFVNITDDFTINVRDVQYVEAAGNFVSSQSISHIRMNLIGRLLLMLDTRMDVASGLDAALGRSAFCSQVIENEMPFAAAYQLATSGDKKDKVQVMLSFLSKAFKSSISQLDWMDSTTKLFAMKKIDEIKTHIGYPAWLLNSSNVDEYYSDLNLSSEGSLLQNILTLRKWRREKILKEFSGQTPPDIWVTQDFSPTTVNVLYAFVHNAILISEGYLQFPYFGSGISAVDYGALGHMLGHEITHGFGNEGMHRDETGRRASWFNLIDEDSFNTQALCFIEQYEQYWTPELRFPISGLENGVRTLEENMADNGGIRAAFEAYKLYVKSSGAQEKILPGLEEYSSEQLFFLSFAHSYCTEWFEIDSIPLSGYSLNWMRVIGTLSNYEEFSRVWQCPQGSAMNPEKKCVLWG